MSIKIKRGDVVEVISGSSRFAPKEKRRGKVEKVYPKKDKVLIRNVNVNKDRQEILVGLPRGMSQ